MITGFVRGQQLTMRSPVIAADTIDYLTALFTFQTREWAGLEKWSHWQNGAVVYDIPLEDDQIPETAHLNLAAGTWYVWLHGNLFENGEVVRRITTEKAQVDVVPTGTLDGEPFPEMPASVTEQILARLDGIEQNGAGGGGTGTVTSVAGVLPDETGNVPLTPEDIGAVAIDVTDEEVNLVVVTGTAAVGQTIVVDSVDEDGYPVSWHAVDLPEGGGTDVEVDDTLSQSGKAADAKVVGDKLGEISEAKADQNTVPNAASVDGSTLKMQRKTTADDGTETTSELFEVELPAGGGTGTVTSVNGVSPDENGNVTVEVGEPTDEQIATAVETWLDEHPEATTTVADGSITSEKLADGAVNGYKMDGAVTFAQIFDRDEWDANGVSNAYLDTGNGKEISANANYKATHYIPCRENTLYTHNLYVRVAGAVCYDKNKIFIGTANITDGQFTTLNGTRYIRFSTASGSQPTNMMICEGESLYDDYYVGVRFGLPNLDFSETGSDNSLQGTKLLDNSVGGSKIQDGSVSRSKVGVISPDSIEGVEFVNLFAAEEYQTDIASGVNTDRVLRGWLQSNNTINTASPQYTTILIPCKPNTEYSLYYMKDGVPTAWSFQGRVGFRDVNKQIFGAYVPESVTFTTPNGAYEIVCTTPTITTPYGDCQKLMFVYGSETPEYVTHKATPRWLQTNAQLGGVSVVCYGDSLTQGKYPSKIASILGVAVVDAGIGGNTVAQIHDRVGNYGTSFDVVTLMTGTNDNGGQTSCPLGTADDEAATDDNASDTTTTYAARLKRLLNKIKSTHRGATFVIMPPFQHLWGANTFEDVSVLMGEIAKQYNMPYLDIYHLCGWSGLDEEDAAMFMEDNTHENDLGAQRIAELLAGFIKQLKGA